MDVCTIGHQLIVVYLGYNVPPLRDIVYCRGVKIFAEIYNLARLSKFSFLSSIHTLQVCRHSSLSRPSYPSRTFTDDPTGFLYSQCLVLASLH